MPRGVALIGCSERRRNVGTAILEKLLESGYRGEVGVVHPRATEIRGIRATSSLSHLKGRVDLCLIALPAPKVLQCIHECAAAEIRAVIVISSGFSESGSAGRELEREVVDCAYERGIRVIGPNCLGVINTDPRAPLNLSFAPQAPLPGAVSLFTQSGAVGIAAIEYARERGIGLSSFVSGGNCGDLTATDLLAHWTPCERTKCIALYLEGVPQGHRFLSMLREATKQKPVVLFKAGVSAAGIIGASSHTAALASDDRLIDAVCDRYGVTRVSSVEELIEVGAFLAESKRVKGNRIGVITNSGGPGIVFADTAERYGLTIPPPTEQDPVFIAHNPTDLGATATEGEFDAALRLFNRSKQFDEVVVIHTRTALRSDEEVTALSPVFERYGAHVLSFGAAMPRAFCRTDLLTASLAASLKYFSYRERKETPPPPPRNHHLNLLEMALEKIKGLDGWLSFEQMHDLLLAFDLPFAPAKITTRGEATVDEVCELADSIGYPVVLKGILPGELHKSEHGLVITGGADRGVVERNAKRLIATAERLHAEHFQILVQSEIADGLEAFIGGTRDPNLGPAVTVGAGGVLVELWNDHRTALAPLSKSDALSLLSHLRFSQLLAGYRNAPPHDAHALAHLIEQTSLLLTYVPAITELDFNPIKVLSHGAVIVDARIRFGKG